MDLHGGTPRAYLKSLANYSLRCVIFKLNRSKSFTLFLKLVEKIVFRRAAKALKKVDSSKNYALRSTTNSLTHVAPFEEYNPKILKNVENTVEIYALYLPQFHPLDVNNQAWGEGFTEWTNVAQSRPLFKGHEQPIIPGLLGFYDLRNKEVIRQQVQLAKSSGVNGFIVFIYWFEDRAVMDQPLTNLREVCEEEKFKYVFEWANEPWTRKWDGLDSEVILHQPKMLNESSATGMFKHFEPHFRSDAYLRKAEIPVFFIYNPSYFINDAVSVVRKTASNVLKQEIHLIGMQTFGTTHQEIIELGYDFSSEYFPHNLNIYESAATVRKNPETISVHVQDYKQVVMKVTSSTSRAGIPSCFPSWDNSPRRRHEGSNVFINCTSESFRLWLENNFDRVIINSADNHLNILIVNAWNEWAEGAILEPSRNSGYAYLNVIKNVVERFICE